MASPMGWPLFASASVMRRCCEPGGGFCGCASRCPSTRSAASAGMTPRLIVMPFKVVLCCENAGLDSKASASRAVHGFIGPPLAIDERRNRRVRQHVARLAAVDERRQAVAAVGGHEDQVAAMALRRFDDRLVRMVALHEV